MPTRGRGHHRTGDGDLGHYGRDGAPSGPQAHTKIYKKHDVHEVDGPCGEEPPEEEFEDGDGVPDEQDEEQQESSEESDDALQFEEAS